jgi:probable HAF family extracellular repeat protein
LGLTTEARLSARQVHTRTRYFLHSRQHRTLCFGKGTNQLRDLGNLGGAVDTGLLAVDNVAFAINNRGQVVGVSALPGNQNIHALLWTDEIGMQDLGTLPGDVGSAGLNINERGDVVGVSVDGNPANGSPRAYLRQNGVMTDLNTFRRTCRYIC